VKLCEKLYCFNGLYINEIAIVFRYGYHPFNVAPSPIKAPIGWFTPKELSGKDVQNTIKDYVQCAVNAKLAGYDGVEVMGSEGYLINQV